MYKKILKCPKHGKGKGRILI